MDRLLRGFDADKAIRVVTAATTGLGRASNLVGLGPGRASLGTRDMGLPNPYQGVARLRSDELATQLRGQRS
jgi:redox-regulated HSP33 family molecular chaperone